MDNGSAPLNVGTRAANYFVSSSIGMARRTECFGNGRKMACCFCVPPFKMESFMAPTSWWSSGLLKEEGTFKEGNGALFTEGEYVNGQLNGMIREWAEDGLLLMSATVKDGEFDGPFKSCGAPACPKKKEPTEQENESDVTPGTTQMARSGDLRTLSGSRLCQESRIDGPSRGRSEEDASCDRSRGLGTSKDADRWYRACLTRAADRRNLCVANKGQSDDEPPVWADRDLR